MFGELYFMTMIVPFNRHYSIRLKPFKSSFSYSVNVMGSRLLFFIGGGGNVCGSGVGFVFLLDVFGVLGLSFVFHISGVSVGVSAVSDDLSATVGEGNTVRSSGNFVVGFLRMVEIDIRFSILDVIAEAVRMGSL